MLRLAAPLALAELGWMAMGAVDTVMAGGLGPAALGAGSLGNMIFYPTVIGATGLLLGMDTLVAQSFGAGDHMDTRRTLVNGIWLALAISPLLAGLILVLIPLLRAAGVNPVVMLLLSPYLEALLWGIPPLLLYTAFRRYLQAVNIVHPVMFALITANLINVLGNWILMYGHWGAPRMGLAGSGWSTSISRLYMAAVLLVAVLWHERESGNRLFRIPWAPNLKRLRRLVQLGLPAAGQIAFEGAVFGLVTVLAAKLDEVSLAAHGIAVQIIGTTFMVPLGISSAASVRVGQAEGRHDPHGASAAGWTALAISGMFMGSAGILLWAAPRFLVHLFIRNSAVVASGAILLRIAAFFQLFDGFQVTATGALRGLGDTRSPMLAHFAGYWIVGLPVAYLLCFPWNWGVTGIWVGLTIALILIGGTLLLVWRRRTISLAKTAESTPKNQT